MRPRQRFSSRWHRRRLGLIALAALVLVAGCGGGGKRGAARPKWEGALTVPATFLADSYGPGDVATFALWQPEKAFSVQFYRAGAGHLPRSTHTTMRGEPVSAVYRFGAKAAHEPIRIRLGDWRSGVYFARLTAGGLVGFAPFVVHPAAPGGNRVLVIEPTFTWQAYNYRDDNGDGVGDTWYASDLQDTVQLDRPFLARGVPPHFAHYDAPFLNWMAETGKKPDFFSDTDLDAAPSARALRDAYDLIVFSGHHEYVTEHEYDLITQYRNLGGHLMFLTSNDFFWRVVRVGDQIVRAGQWRSLGRPEASVIGVEYIANDNGTHQAPWTVTNVTRWPWLFAGTGLKVGSTFGSGGVEIDHRTPHSPPGLTIVADMPKVIPPGFTAQMSYYENPAGAEVFAAGAFTLAGESDVVSHRILQNLWDHMTLPSGA